MKALTRNNGKLGIEELEIPKIKNSNQVLIKVEIAAICRTDVRAARGLIKTADKLVLGHEFSGRVVDHGKQVEGLKLGQRVAVMPILFCNTCSSCQNSQFSCCQASKMLGIDYDGCFAEYVLVPSSAVYPISDALSYHVAAYAEPVAASLAVLKAGMQKDEQGCIFGDNRIAKLTSRILTALGYQRPIVITKDDQLSATSSQFNYGIETLATTECVKALIDIIKPQGKLILKSRQYVPLEINVADLVKKELNMVAVNYAPFSQALEVLESGMLDLSDLIGHTYGLDDFESAFISDSDDESKKSFFKIGELCAGL